MSREAVGAGHAAALAGEQRQVADEVAVGEVDGLLARAGDADRGRADVVLAVVDRGEQAREVLAGELRLQPLAARDVLEQLDVKAGEGAVRVGVGVGLGVADAGDPDHALLARAERVAGGAVALPAAGGEGERRGDGHGTAADQMAKVHVSFSLEDVMPDNGGRNYRKRLGSTKS